jgi:hypothetical protein
LVENLFISTKKELVGILCMQKRAEVLELAVVVVVVLIVKPKSIQSNPAKSNERQDDEKYKMK